MTQADRPDWPAPYAADSVRGVVHVPGAKSATNRALVLAALATGPSKLRRPLRSRDTDLMADALRALGTEITDDGENWAVVPGELHGPADVDVGLAGTVMRFMPPVATLASGEVRFDGDPRARERPMAPLLGALRALGANIDDGGRGLLPFALTGTGSLPGGRAELDASSSSQLVSGLLLSAPRWDAGAHVTHVGSRDVPNAPHVRMTVAMLRDRGVTVKAAPGVWQVDPGPIAGHTEVVEPDLSNAAPFLAAAVVTGGEVTVADWPASSTQPGEALPKLLGAFGASTSYHDRSLTVTCDGPLQGADLYLRDAGELVPVLAAIAAVATGPSTFRGIDYLRGHETDRLSALATELTALGGKVEEFDDGLRIEPSPLHGGVFHTYDDHRLAMAAAVLGLVVDGVVVENVETTAKTYRGFAADWQQLVTGSHS